MFNGSSVSRKHWWFYVCSFVFFFLIYLAALGLICSFLELSWSMRYLSSLGLNLGPLHWEHGISHWTIREIPSVGFLSYKQHKGLPWWLRWWGICLPTHKTQIQSLGQEDPLEEEMATHSRLLAWKIPRTEEPGGLQPMGSQRVGHDWATNTHTYNIKTFTQLSSARDPGKLHEDRILSLIHH